MRELFSKEMEMVSAAGLVTDDPRVEEAMRDFDILCGIGEAATEGIKGSHLSESISTAKKTVHEAVNLMDAIYTQLFNNINKWFS
ncbi:hypothetical protein [Cedecea sp.]|jgi:hypothetical protein|uniref:hypothetical protein n=1 Tax=Cedecea sp. TaxID=1970739 RepID=UPI002F425BB3